MRPMLDGWSHIILHYDYGTTYTNLYDRSGQLGNMKRKFQLIFVATSLWELFFSVAAGKQKL